MDTEDKKVTLRDGEGSKAPKGRSKYRKEDLEPFFENLNEELNSKIAKEKKEVAERNDLGFSRELCNFLGIDPTEHYYVDETERQRLVAKIEMIVAHAGVVAAKYLLAILSSDHMADRERVKMSLSLVKLNIGEPPQRTETEAATGVWEVLLKETNTSVRQVKVRVAGNPDGNGNNK